MREEQLYRRSTIRELDKDRGDSGARRDPHKGSNSDLRLKDGHHARHRNRSRGRNPKDRSPQEQYHAHRGWDPRTEKDSHDICVDGSLREERWARRSGDRRRESVRGASANISGSSGSPTTLGSEEGSRGRRHVEQSSGRRSEDAVKRREEPNRRSRIAVGGGDSADMRSNSAGNGSGDTTAALQAISRAMLEQILKSTPFNRLRDQTSQPGSCSSETGPIVCPTVNGAEFHIFDHGARKNRATHTRRHHLPPPPSPLSRLLRRKKLESE